MGGAKLILRTRKSSGHDRDEDSAANMASPPSPPAVRSIGILTPTIELSFKNIPINISSSLLSRGLISGHVHEKILLVSLTETEKAAILVQAVKNTIKRDPEKFEDFLKVLSEHNDTISVETDLRSTCQEIIAKESQTAQNSSSKDSCAEPTPKRPKLSEPRGRIQSSLSDEPDVCEAAEVPHRRSSLKISNPVIENYSELGDDDKENIANQIQNLAGVIDKKFLKLGNLVLQSLDARKIEPKLLVNTLTQCEVYSTETERKEKLFQLHSRDLAEAKDIYRIFRIISPYYSWFNYELFKKIVNTHGSDEDKKDMEQYCQDFSEYCQRIPCVEFQENRSKSSHKTKIKFKLDLDKKSLNLYEIKCIQRNIARILKLQSSVLVLSSIEDGCMALVFLVPSHIAAQLIAIAVDEKAILCQEIKMISVDQEQDHPYQGENGHNHQEYFESAKQGDLKRVQALIEGGIEIDTVDEKNYTALLHASHEGHINIVTFLLEKGANSNWQADDGWTALILASYRGHVKIIELLLQSNSDVNLTTQHGWTALQRLCLYNQTRYPDAKYKASERRAEVAKLLIDHGTDIWKVDKEGRTALIAASDSGFADIVKVLVHKASQFPDEERQRYLDHKRHYSWTALMSASEKGHADVIRILIEAGASRSITKDKDDVTALHIAVHSGHVEAAEVLTHKISKEDINARDNYGMTPLILATQRNSEQLINVLIHAGADVDAKNEDQMTALMFAVKVGSLDVVKLLAEKSTKLFAMNSRDEILFEMAKNSTREIEEYLLEKYKKAEMEHAKKTTESH